MRPVLLILILALLGCGQRGALYLPEESAGEVVTVQPPGQQAERPASGTAAESGEDEEENAETEQSGSDESGPGESGEEPSGADGP